MGTKDSIITTKSFVITWINGAEIEILTEHVTTDAINRITVHSAVTTVVTAHTTESTILTSTTDTTGVQTVVSEFGTARTQGFTTRISA